MFDGHVKEPYEIIFGVGSPTVGQTSSVRLHIYVPSHIKLQAVPNDVPYIQLYLGDNTFVIEWIAGHKLYQFWYLSQIWFYRDASAVKRVFATVKWYNFMPANHSSTNRCYLHSKTRFHVLLRRVARDVTSSLLSWHKRYDFNAANVRRQSQWKCALQTLWIRIKDI